MTFHTFQLDLQTWNVSPLHRVNRLWPSQCLWQMHELHLKDLNNIASERLEEAASHAYTPFKSLAAQAHVVTAWQVIGVSGTKYVWQGTSTCGVHACRMASWLVTHDIPHIHSSAIIQIDKLPLKSTCGLEGMHASTTKPLKIPCTG